MNDQNKLVNHEASKADDRTNNKEALLGFCGPLVTRVESNQFYDFL